MTQAGLENMRDFGLHVVASQSAEYGTFRRDLRCARAKLLVCRCASSQISGVLVYTKPLWLKFGKVIVHFVNALSAKSICNQYFYCLKYSKIWSTKQANMGLAEVFRAKVEDMSSTKFPGGGGCCCPQTPHCPLFICQVYVLISKIS